jgi:hypothetical protein
LTINAAKVANVVNSVEERFARSFFANTANRKTGRSSWANSIDDANATGLAATATAKPNLVQIAA